MASILGIGLMFSPSPIAIKIGIGLSGIALNGYQFLLIKGQKNKEKGLATKSNKKLQDELIKLTLKTKELEEKERSLANFSDELLLLEEKITRQEKLARQEIEEEIKRSRIVMAREQDDMIADWAMEETRLRQKLTEDLEANKQAFTAQMMTELSDKQEAIRELDQEYQEKEKLLEEELERRLITFEQELANKRKEDDKELEEAEQTLTNNYVQKRDELIQELNQLKEELNQEYQQKYEDWLVPHYQEMDRLLKEIESLKATIEYLQEELADNVDIRLPSDIGTPHADRSTLILMWLKEQGIYADYKSSIILPDDTFVLTFLPKIIGNSTEKKIKGLLLAMQVKFGLQSPPKFEPNPSARGWSLTYYPNHSTPIPLNEFFVRRLPEETLMGETFKDIEPALQEAIARRLSYEEQHAEMMNFSPPVPLQKPYTRQITELEWSCFKWYYSWRALATNGNKPNVTTRKELLWHIYQVREGRASSNLDPLLGESLGQRVKRILNMLEAESNQQAIDYQD